MKSTQKRTLCLLVFLLLLPVKCLADTPVANDWMHQQVLVSGRSYTFPMQVKTLKELGFSMPDGIKNGYRYSEAFATGALKWTMTFNAHYEDDAVIEQDELWATGFTLTENERYEISLPNSITIGKSSIEDIKAIYGEPGNENQNNLGTSLMYFFCNNMIQLRFDLNAENVLRKIEYDNNLLQAYGEPFSEPITSQSQVDPNTLKLNEYVLNGIVYSGPMKLATLLDDGWRLKSSADVSRELEGNDWMVSYVSPLLFNGSGLLQTGVYNSGGKGAKCTLIEGDMYYIGVNYSHHTPLVLKNGITLGSSFEDVQAVFGSGYEEIEKLDSGSVYYEFSNVFGSTTFGFTIMTDGTVGYLRVYAR